MTRQLVVQEQSRVGSIKRFPTATLKNARRSIGRELRYELSLSLGYWDVKFTNM